MVDERDDRHVLAAKLFAEVQAEGLRAAGALVDRIVHLVDGPPAEDATDEAEAGSPLDMGAVLPWLDLWRDLIERTSQTVERIRAATPLSPTTPVTVDVVDGEGRGEMWLHNGTGQDQGELVPQCGPLSDGHGNVLDCDIGVNPPKIDQLHSGSSRGFTLSVRTGPAAPPGVYRGVMQVRGAESVWTPVEVRVKAPAR